MTPDERFDAHEQWLLDHDRWLVKHQEGMEEIREILRQTSDIQRKQSAVMLEIAQHVARLLDREDGAQ